jgi:uridine phosphorylase
MASHVSVLDLLPGSKYDRVLIHDNWKAIQRYIDRYKVIVKGKYQLRRYMLYHLDVGAHYVAAFGTGLGSAQTNRLLELLAANGREFGRKFVKVVKVGTCSALQGGLNFGDVVVPAQALIDEGATKWRRIKRDHDDGRFNTQEAVLKYIQGHEVALPDRSLSSGVANALARTLENQPRTGWGVWSVDSYESFDQSPALYGQVEGQSYDVPEFLGGPQSAVTLAGVEMECSSLFSSAHASHPTPEISAAAVIVVSRTRDLLLYQNARDLPADAPPTVADGIPKSEPLRDTNRIEGVEDLCMRAVVNFLSTCWIPP